MEILESSRAISNLKMDLKLPSFFLMWNLVKAVYHHDVCKKQYFASPTNAEPCQIFLHILF